MKLNDDSAAAHPPLEGKVDRRSAAKRSGGGRGGVKESHASRSPTPLAAQSSLRRLRKLVCGARDPPPPGEGGTERAVSPPITRACRRHSLAIAAGTAT